MECRRQLGQQRGTVPALRSPPLVRAQRVGRPAAGVPGSRCQDFALDRPSKVSVPSRKGAACGRQQTLDPSLPPPASMWTTISPEMGSEGLGGGAVPWEGAWWPGEGVHVPGVLWDRETGVLLPVWSHLRVWGEGWRQEPRVLGSGPSWSGPQFPLIFRVGGSSSPLSSGSLAAPDISVPRG